MSTYSLATLKLLAVKAMCCWAFQLQAILATSLRRLKPRAKGMKVITLTGKDGGKMAGSADVEIRVPHFGYADRIQEIHIKAIHILIQLIEKEMVK